MTQSLKELSTPYLNWHTLQINWSIAVNVAHVQKLPFSRDLILLLVDDHLSSNYHISGGKKKTTLLTATYINVLLFA